MTKTRKDYENYLNGLLNYYDEDHFLWLKAKSLLSQGKLGTATRRHDPIGFNVGFNEFKLEK